MSKEIKINCDEKLTRVPFEQLHPTQGALKSLSEDNYDKLSKSILSRGFFVPMFTWRENAEKIRILDGHQRFFVLNKMKEIGYTVPKIPVVFIEAKSLKEAKEKLLLIASQFGRVDGQGLYEFLIDSEIDPRSLITDWELPNLDGLKFMDEFFSDDNLIDPLAPLNPSDSASVPAGIKMLPLFFSEAQHAEAMKMIESLASKYSAANATDTVFEALKNEFQRNKN